MQKYVTTYLRHFDLGEQSNWFCEACLKPDHIQNFDIHHIHGRSRETINDLICLCRKCHNRAHGSRDYVSKDEFQLIHNNFMIGNRKIFLR